MPATRGQRRGRRLARGVVTAALLAGVSASIVLITVLAVLTSGQLGGRAQAASPLDDRIIDATGESRFTFIRWELETAPNHWLELFAEVIHGAPSCDLDEAVRRLESGGLLRDPVATQCLERALEDATTGAIAELGLATALPLFRGQSIVWPPVQIELRDAPRVLAVSPRSEIRLVRSVLLEPRLPRHTFGEIEAIVEFGGDWSAWVQSVGGVATYPALVIPRPTWRDTLRLVGHEWVHHYLIFHPLGRAYFRSDDLRTINETVADIVGDEIGAQAAGPETGSEDRSEADELRDEAVDDILRNLRLEVDALLAEGQIVEAEVLMESTRGRLAVAGARYRRINQAFFAFRGGYATQIGAASPYGPLLEELRTRSGSVADFVVAIRGVGSVSDADALLGAR